MAKKMSMLVSSLLVVMMLIGVVGQLAAQEPVTFIFGRGGDSVQLDPAVVTDGESFRATGQGCDGLLTYAEGTTEVVPALATDWSVSDDDLTWTFNLREGVTFHDGTPFNAEAVKFNFERWRFTDNPYHFEEQAYEYYEYMWGGFDADSVIVEVNVVDDLTIDIVLSEPQSPMLSNMAMDMFAIASPTAIMEYGPDYGTPEVGYVCTGPFEFVEWQTDDVIVLDAYEGYWGEPVGNVDRVIIRVIPDNSARFAALQSGEIHALEQANVEDLAIAEEAEDLYVTTIPALNTFYLAFSYLIDEFQNPLVREAISLAIDRQAIVDAFYGPYGEVANNFLPPLVWGHNDDVMSVYDVDRARELLAEAGYPDGFSEVTVDGETIPLTLYYMPIVRFYNPDGEGIAQAQAQNLAEIGIEVEIATAGDWATYLQMRREGALTGLYQLGWGGDNGDPDNFLCYFFCDGPKPTEGFYENPELNAVLQEARVVVDQAERQALYEQAEMMLSEDTGRVWIGHNSTPVVLRSTAQNYIPQPVGAENYELVTITE